MVGWETYSVQPVHHLSLDVGNLVSEWVNEMVDQKRIERISDALKDHRGAYSFYFYPGASLTSDGQFLQYHVALVTSETAQEGAGYSASLTRLFRYLISTRPIGLQSKQDIKMCLHLDEEYAKSVLLDCMDQSLLIETYTIGG